MKFFRLMLVMAGVLAFAGAVALTGACDDDDDDDNDDGGGGDCATDWTQDQLDCAAQIPTSTRKESAICVIDAFEDLIDCVGDAGQCGNACDCADDCIDQARDCIDPCADDGDDCLDACDGVFQGCLDDCDWEDFFNGLV